ncbi:MAG: sulfatase-like hydrolase/transferase [Puniceicoccales bacterium]|jgi:glucan phosphoethanolaminetransferase (alkaline phosphatase superfamily)|nr:sulfatase-like hydrolase/transferase [Puniceicoccales bacterium]
MLGGKIMRKPILPILLLSFLTILLLMFPDFIFAAINDTFKISRDWKAILFLIPLSVGLVLSPAWFAVLTLLFFSCMQVAQFIHCAYFGVQLSPFALHFMQKEMGDVGTEIAFFWKDYGYVIPMVFIPFFLIYFLNRKSVVKKTWIGILIISCIFGSIGKRLCTDASQRFTPNSRRITLYNSLKAFFGYFIIKYRHYDFNKTYQPYAVEKNQFFERESPINIVYIIGESCNYRHMSLFGYGRNDTTPRLKSLAQNNDNFIFQVGISGANSTLSSVKFITNAIYEPDNLKQTSLETTNLFKLAKQNNFKTFYLSMQCDTLLAAIGGAPHMDQIVTKETDPIQIRLKKDLYLLKLIQKQTFSEKNFIVLHQSSVHSPYELTYGQGYKAPRIFFGNPQKILDDYDNAMLYNDFLISQIFEFFNGSKDPFYIVWASDHNELLGENGMYGHGSGCLVPEVTQIPVIVQSNDPLFLKKINNTFAITHYEIAKFLAEQIGFDIINPNEEEKVFYSNGIDYNGKLGYIRVTKDSLTKTIKYEPSPCIN